MWDLIDSFIVSVGICVMTGLFLGPLFCSLKGDRTTWIWVVLCFCIIWRIEHLVIYGSGNALYNRSLITKNYYEWFFCDGVWGFGFIGFMFGFAVCKCYNYFKRNKGYNPISEREQNNILQKRLHESVEVIKENERYVQYIKNDYSTYKKEYNTLKCQLSQKDIELNQLKEYLQQHDPKVLENFELYKRINSM